MSNHRNDSQIKWKILESVRFRSLEEPEAPLVSDVRKDVSLNYNAMKKKLGELESVGAVVIEGQRRVRLSEKGLGMMNNLSEMMSMLNGAEQKTYVSKGDYARAYQDPMIRKYRERLSQDYVIGKDQINWPRIVYDVMLERVLENKRVTSVKDIGLIKKYAIEKAEKECGSAFKNGSGRRGYSRRVGHVYSNIVGIGLLFLNSN